MPRVSKTGTRELFRNGKGLLSVDLRFWNKKLDRRDRFRKTFEARTSQRAAELFVRQLRVEIDSGTFDRHAGGGDDKPRSVAKILEGYLQWCADEQQRSLAGKRSLVNVVNGFLGEIDASQLCAADVQKYRRRRQLTSATGCTINRGLTLIKHAALLGRAQGDQTGVGPWGAPWMDGERLAQIQGVRQLPKNPRRDRRPQGDELARLLKALTPPMVPIVKAGLYTGLRAANVARLRRRRHGG